MERTGHFKRDGHAAARQRQHKDVRTVGVISELRRQMSARLAAVSINHRFGAILIAHLSPPLCAVTKYLSGTQTRTSLSVRRDARLLPAEHVQRYRNRAQGPGQEERPADDLAQVAPEFIREQ